MSILYYPDLISELKKDHQVILNSLNHLLILSQKQAPIELLQNEITSLKSLIMTHLMKEATKFYSYLRQKTRKMDLKIDKKINFKTNLKTSEQIDEKIQEKINNLINNGNREKDVYQQISTYKHQMDSLGHNIIQFLDACLKKEVKELHLLEFQKKLEEITSLIQRQIQYEETILYPLYRSF